MIKRKLECAIYNICYITGYKTVVRNYCIFCGDDFNRNDSCLQPKTLEKRIWYVIKSYFTKPTQDKE